MGLSNSKHPNVLSLAGFDPSGGAGILADIKTFEQHKVTGMGVVTGLTFQNESEFDSVKWVAKDDIIDQIKVLARKYTFDFVKIGMIQDLETLASITSELETQKLKLIWDPILKASAGYEIHKKLDKKKLHTILKNVFLITPNLDEIRILMEEENETKAAKELSKYCHVFLKGGHRLMEEGKKKGNDTEGSQKQLAKDYLFTTEGKIYPYKAKEISKTGKHGSGCVLSSAITANLANGNDLQHACLKGKDYVTKFLMSSKTMLGHHKN